LTLLALGLAAAAAGVLFFTDQPHGNRPSAYMGVRRGLESVIGPVETALGAPARWIGQGVDSVSSYLMAGSQNQALKRELAAERTWRIEALRLREENGRLRALMGVKTDPPLPMLLARTVLDARGPFANGRLANAGSAEGVREGNPVMSDLGLVGRVAGLSDHVSRVALLTDTTSRTPVLIARTNARAILAGDGGPNPEVTFLRGTDPLRPGDRVLTSGDGGVYPRGLNIGVALKGLDGAWRVALDSDHAPVDFVRILLFTDFSQVAKAEALTPDALPSLSTAAPLTGPPTTTPGAQGAPKAPGPAPPAAPAPRPAP
jgi:rod shape-determining protein MreC